MGATATGKTALAVRLCMDLHGDVVSMDSRQVYRGLDIGTGKPTREELDAARHYLIDTLDPDEANSAGRHVRMADEAVDDIRARGRRPFLVGGTGLYFRAYFDGLIDTEIDPGTLGALRDAMADLPDADLYDELRRVDPDRARELSPNDRVRITRALEIYRATGETHSSMIASQERGRRGGLKVVLTMPRAALRERIAERTRAMFAAGWVDEVRRMLDRGGGKRPVAMNSLGYSRIADALEAGEDPDATIDDVIRMTQQYAKRQETFFRGFPDAVWIDVADGDPYARVRAAIDGGGRV